MIYLDFQRTINSQPSQIIPKKLHQPIEKSPVFKTEKKHGNMFTHFHPQLTAKYSFN